MPSSSKSWPSAAAPLRVSPAYVGVDGAAR